MHMDTHTSQEQWILDCPEMRRFIEAVREARTAAGSLPELLARLEPPFEALLADAAWLPERFMHPSENSGMGGGIGMWLLYRSADGDLAFSSLVVPPGSETPVHDHLTWGLVGIYRGTQEETVYRAAGPRGDGSAPLVLSEVLHLAPGDHYRLTPDNDIHKVRTTSPETSVSLHLLGNDNGCTWRHQYDPEADAVADFRSGWLNAECREY